MSSPSSPLLPTTPKRRLSARRGSISAPDPFAKHADLNRSLSSSSTLTIVKVVNGNSETIALQEPPTGPGRRQQHQHRRIGSNSSDNGNGGAGGRLSFAFSSFGPRNSPPTSPRLRPSSPIRHHSLPQHKPRLTPDQLYDLAHQTTNPKYFPASPAVNDASPYRPESPHRPASPSYFRRSPVLSAVNTANVNTTTAPATFTPLPPSVFLPFMDRPAEVATLISSAPTKKLFALLRQTFPRDPSSPTSPDPLSSPQLPSVQPTSPLPKDAATWTYNDLIAFLTTTPRSDMPDTLWVAKIRKCILSRSELIWERVKGALGVPPELDVDANFLEDAEMHGDVFEESEGEEEMPEEKLNTARPRHIRTETDEMEDHGRKARGHWDDWDMVLSSPEVERSMDSGTKDEEGTTTVAPTPRQHTPPDQVDIPVITQELPTPSEDAFDPKKGHQKSRSSISLNPADFGLASSPILSPTERENDSQLIIEPLMSPSTSNSAVPSLHPPPLSLPSSLSLESPSGNAGALGDIMEGEEEEEEEENKEKEDTPTQEGVAKDRDNEKENAIDPCQIHGLRISLPGTPVSPNSNWRDVLYGNQQSQSSASSPIEITGSLGRKRPLSIGGSPNPSASPSSYGFGSTGAGLVRTGSSGSIKSLGSSSSKRNSYLSSYTHGTPGSDGGYESDGIAYDPVGDRAPGNPLFPSNFARLATGPTLAAK